MAGVDPLLKCHIAHGDLQHGNVLVTSQGRVRFVDYDGMYIPAFAGDSSPEVGHINFQHPVRRNHDYHEHLDAFAGLVIYLSLRAVALMPSLWAQFHTGDNLIFSARDYRQPGQSAIFRRLHGSADTEIKLLAALLQEVCLRRSVEAPTLDEITHAHYHAISGIRRPAHEQIAQLAYSFWEERGRTGGSADEDWYTAERQLLLNLG